jgi:hypothetical protein
MNLRFENKEILLFCISDDIKEGFAMTHLHPNQHKVNKVTLKNWEIAHVNFETTMVFMNNIR